MDDHLLSERIQIERKQFFFDLKENEKGRFLKVTEDVGGRRDTIIIPTSGLISFRESLDKIIKAASIEDPQDLLRTTAEMPESVEVAQPEEDL